jgi:high-affinity nickel-transport protein
MSGFRFPAFKQSGLSFRQRIATLFVSLVVANLLVWIWALVVLRDNPVLLGTAFLAYTFGLRHAVDADHIAAIDNATRKLMQDGTRPVALGLFFSLGHSTIVIVMSVLVGFTAFNLSESVPELKQVGGIVSTLASAGFLFFLAFFNILIFRSTYRTFKAVKAGKTIAAAEMDMLLGGNGFLTRIFRSLFQKVSKSWHLFPIGFLFGLGFDTATEVALFGISAAQAMNGQSFSVVLVFPALFTVAMSLVDTIDGMLMIGAYGWAYDRPIRKLFYNMTITAVSILVALLIGGIETLGLIGEKLGLEGDFWEVIGILAGNFGVLGYVIIGVFIVSWLVSVAIYRLKGYGDMEQSPVLVE